MQASLDPINYVSQPGNHVFLCHKRHWGRWLFALELGWHPNDLMMPVMTAMSFYHPTRYEMAWV